jgi:multiple sugar transport system permease protein
MERRSLLASILIHGAALLLAGVILAPIFWLFVMSISPAADLVARPLHWWPSEMDFSRYAILLSTIPNSAGAAFVASLVNSILVAGMATVASIVLAIPAGWAVSRTPSIGWSLSLVIATYMLPPVALAVRSTWRSRRSGC